MMANNHGKSLIDAIAGLAPALAAGAGEAPSTPALHAHNLRGGDRRLKRLTLFRDVASTGGCPPEDCKAPKKARPAEPTPRAEPLAAAEERSPEPVRVREWITIRRTTITREYSANPDDFGSPNPGWSPVRDFGRGSPQFGNYSSDDSDDSSDDDAQRAATSGRSTGYYPAAARRAPIHPTVRSPKKSKGGRR